MDLDNFEIARIFVVSEFLLYHLVYNIGDFRYNQFALVYIYIFLDLDFYL